MEHAWLGPQTNGEWASPNLIWWDYARVVVGFRDGYMLRLPLKERKNPRRAGWRRWIGGCPEIASRVAAHFGTASHTPHRPNTSPLDNSPPCPAVHTIAQPLPPNIAPAYWSSQNQGTPTAPKPGASLRFAKLNRYRGAVHHQHSLRTAELVGHLPNQLPDERFPFPGNLPHQLFQRLPILVQQVG